MVVWMHEDAMRVGGRYDIKLATATAPAQISGLRYVVDVNTMHRIKGETPAEQLELNEIGRCHITLHRSVAFDPYERNRSTGGFILIDRITNATVGAGMILDRVVSASSNPEPVSQNITQSTSLVSSDDRQKLLGQRGTTIWLTGLSGSGKSTVAQELERRLVDQGHACIVLDGDNVRHGLNRDLGFSADDRQENIRRISEVAKLFNDAGLIVITAFISPYRADRDAAREIVRDGFVEVFVNTPLEICEQRDPKGLYKKARAGVIPNFTGISAPYEEPEKAELVIDTSHQSLEDSAAEVLAYLEKSGLFQV
jgi:bifunctional enzyme CysN/CysC